MDYIKLSNSFYNEATELLLKYNFKKLLSQFGKFYITGSYSYNVMTWRDIDITLSVKNPSPKLLMKIGNEISKIDCLVTMYYRNEFILKTSGNPEAIFWCCEFLFKSNIWKIDILVSKEEIIKNIIKPGKDLKKIITPEIRNKILLIKSELTNDPDYRVKFRSTDIYNAVINDNISNINDWKSWWLSQNKT